MPELSPGAVLLSGFLDSAERRQLARRFGRGEVVKLHRGAYVESALWAGLDEGARHRAKALAVALHFDDGAIFTHLTGAAFWRLPRIGQWPTVPHIAGPVDGASRTAAFARHGLGIPPAVERIDDLNVSTLGATIIDVATTVGFAHAVVLADAALRRTAHPLVGVPSTALVRGDLLTELERVSPTHGATKAQRVIEFADGRADRPGESLSRVSMRRARLTPPDLQVSLRGASGKSYDVDFWWEEFNVIGEFDGKYKYTDPAYMNGRTPEQVLYDEKVREDDLRAASHGFSRWPWATAISPALLRAHLARSGIR
jgi:hypothetical protein